MGQVELRGVPVVQFRLHPILTVTDGALSPPPPQPWPPTCPSTSSLLPSLPFRGPEGAGSHPSACSERRKWPPLDNQMERTVVRVGGGRVSRRQWRAGPWRGITLRTTSQGGSQSALPASRPSSSVMASHICVTSTSTTGRLGNLQRSGRHYGHLLSTTPSPYRNVWSCSSPWPSSQAWRCSSVPAVGRLPVLTSNV